MRILSILSFSFLCVACDSDAAKRPIGSTCGEPSQCESNICVSNVCIDPVGCATAFANNGPSGLVEACMVGLQSIQISPADAQGVPGDTVQFTATGFFGDSSGSASVSVSAPGGSAGSDGALTIAQEANLTALVTWQGGELVTFDTEGSPGLGTIASGATGRVTVSASISKGTGAGEDGPRVVTGSASLTVTGSASPRPTP